MKILKILSVLFFLSGCSSIPPKELTQLNASIQQAIIVHPIDHNSSQAQLSAWQKNNQGWQKIYKTSAVLGRTGLAEINEKKEGDGHTPRGIYPLEFAFGYDSFLDTKLDYRQSGWKDVWVDDPKSPQYNQWVTGQPQADSFEKMRREDNLYQMGIVIGYNTNPVIAGKGSAIFMHIWRNYYKPTAGCIALNQRHLKRILRWLNKNNQPVIILE